MCRTYRALVEILSDGKPWPWHPIHTRRRVPHARNFHSVLKLDFELNHAANERRFQRTCNVTQQNP
jgi:hypothetical protein